MDFITLNDLPETQQIAGTDILLTKSTDGIDKKVTASALRDFAKPDSASASNDGIVTTSSQTFAGDKTFNNDVEVKGTLVAPIIPSDATAENPLTTEEFVNSSIATNTAVFRGTFNSVSELNAYTGPKTNNDYAFVIGADEQGNTRYARYKYTGSAWEFEYYLNNSSFTAEQWAAIQSGITAELVALIGQASGSSPIGTILSFAGENVPAGFLLCDGRELLIEDYPKLYEAIGHLPYCQSENEGYFKLPDLREVVIVGAGQNETNEITEHDVYELGEFKDDQLQGHSHEIEWSDGSPNHSVGGLYSGGGSYNSNVKHLTELTIKDPTADGTNGTPRVGTTTHGKQVGFNYIIKATSTDDGIDEIIDDNTTDNGHAWSGEKISNELDTKQDVLISEGESQNIKTINGESILGAGNIPINATPQVITLDWNSVRGDTLATYIRNALDNGTYFASGCLYHGSQSSSGVESIYKVYKSGGTLYLYAQSQTGGNTNYLTSVFTCSVHLVLFKYA